MGDKLHGREGNNPDRRLRPQNSAQSERTLEYCDSRDVGLEAAIIQRVRNSSLVKWLCAENVTGLKSNTEAADCRNTMVGERSHRAEA